MLTTAEAAREVGASYRQLDYWARKGALLPEGERGGSGSNRRWPDREVRVARVLRQIAELVHGGAPVRSDVAAMVRSTPEPLWLVVGASYVCAVNDEDLGQALVMAGDAAIVVGLPPA